MPEIAIDLHEVSDTFIAALLCETVLNGAERSSVFDELVERGRTDLIAKLSNDERICDDVMARIFELLIADPEEWGPELLEHPRMTRTVLEAVANTGGHVGAEAAMLLLNSEGTTAEMLAHYAASPDPTVRHRVARHANTDPTTLTVLVTDDEEFVRYAAIGNENCPASAYEHLAVGPPFNGDSPPAEMLSVAQSHLISADSLAALAERHWLLAHCVACNPNTDGDTLRVIYAGENFGSQSQLESLVRHPNCPVDVIREILGERRGSSTLEMIVATREDLGPELLEELLDGRRGGVIPLRVRVVAAANPACSAETLQRRSRSPHNPERAAVASNPSTPPDTLDVLASDTSKLVREAVASNPSTLAPTLLRLINRPVSKTQRCAMRNVRTPSLFGYSPEVWHTALGDRDIRVSDLVAELELAA